MRPQLLRRLGLLLVVLALFSPALSRAEIACEKWLVREQVEAPKRPIESLQTLKVGTYNVENLFMHLGHHEPDPGDPTKMNRVTEQENKPLRKVEGVARALRDLDLDLVALQEVENIEALRELNSKYLGDKYIPVLVEGNDSRGIDVAFLIKRDLPFEIENYSFRNETWRDPRYRNPRPSKIFSRDLPALIVRAKGQPKDAPPLFVFIGTHYKSKRDFNDPNAIRPDPESRLVRGAQVDRSVEIIEKFRQEFGADVPILMAGDFNGAMNFEPEYRPLKQKARLEDAFNYADRKVPDINRVTHVYFPFRGQPDARQMDAVLVSPELQGNVVKAEVYRYKRPDGRPFPLPREKWQRDKNPSDHWPVAVTLRFAPFRKRIPPAAP